MPKSVGAKDDFGQLWSSAFSALTLLVDGQEEHPACNN